MYQYWALLGHNVEAQYNADHLLDLPYKNEMGWKPWKDYWEKTSAELEV